VGRASERLTAPCQSSCAVQQLGSSSGSSIPVLTFQPSSIQAARIRTRITPPIWLIRRSNCSSMKVSCSTF
jgi:hypothetical protein